MISHVDTTAVNLELSDDIKKYINRKIGNLDKAAPKKIRRSIEVKINMRETGNRLGNKYECQAVLQLPGATIQAKEATLNMFAAVDIVEAKLRNQLSEYKESHNKKTLSLFKRFKNRFSQ